MHLSLFALPVPGISLHFVSNIVAVETEPGVYAVVFEQKWIFAVLFRTQITERFLSLGQHASSIDLRTHYCSNDGDIRAKTFVAYRQLSMVAKKRYGHDFHLFGKNKRQSRRPDKAQSLWVRRRFEQFP